MLIKEIIDFSFINSNVPKIYKLNTNLKLDTKIYSGIYTYTIGPTYETKTEIDEIISLGGDAVGMSTFPHYIMCNKLGVNPIIISCLTNYGAGLTKQKVLHKDVLKNAEKVKLKFSSLIRMIIQNTVHQKRQKI